MVEGGSACAIEQHSPSIHKRINLVRDPIVDLSFHLWHIPSMAWEVEYTSEFGAWWDSLTIGEQKDVSLAVTLLEEKGPALRRPYVGTILNSKHANMKELVIQHAGKPYRVLFAFDPHRTGILLIGGDKTGNHRWYGEFIPVADALFDDHLKQLRGKKAT
jgi:hypothetical protein